VGADAGNKEGPQRFPNLHDAGAGVFDALQLEDQQSGELRAKETL